jgi:hypothetical protein
MLLVVTWQVCSLMLLLLRIVVFSLLLCAQLLLHPTCCASSSHLCRVILVSRAFSCYRATDRTVAMLLLRIAGVSRLHCFVRP